MCDTTERSEDVEHNRALLGCVFDHSVRVKKGSPNGELFLIRHGAVKGIGHIREYECATQASEVRLCFRSSVRVKKGSPNGEPFLLCRCRIPTDYISAAVELISSVHA